jgi:ABC-type multidrug transport system fused ATPase/permease subunit
MAEKLYQEEALSKSYDSVLMRRLLHYARPHWRSILFCIFLLALLSACGLTMPYLVKLAIDQVIAPATQGQVPRSELLSRLGWLTGLYGLLIALNFALGYWQTLLLQQTGQRIIYRLRSDLFAHLQRLSLSYFDAHPVGRLVTRVTNDIETLNEMYTSVLVNLFRDCFSIVGLMGMLFYLNRTLAWIALGMLPVVFANVWIFRGLARENFRDMRTRVAGINAFIAENLSGLRTIQIFHREARQIASFTTANRAYFDSLWWHLQLFGLFRPSLDLLASFALALVLWRGGILSAAGAIELGTLYAFTSYVRQLFNPINELAEKFNLLQAAMASSERIFQLLDTEPEIRDREGAIAPPSLVGGIAFDRVWFAYEGDNWVLKNVSFQVEPGQTIAFVGHTGAGKSSILSLIARFYDVQRGVVRLDGQDVRDLTQASLRRGIGFVLQDVFLFAGDVRGNIRLDHPEISPEAVEEAARAVGADAFIRDLPGGYEAQLTERGSTLSTGQRQLIAFARALAFDPAILVLDEATANVDSETEAVIQEALRRLTAGRTTLIVAHRLSTIQRADRILVLHRGEIRETGTHAELIAREGLYHKLWRLQAEQQEGLALQP